MSLIPPTIFTTFCIPLAFKIEAAIQIGKEEYPPIPKIIDGLLFKRNKKDRIIENDIIKKEKRSLNRFFFSKGDYGNLSKFNFLAPR